MKCIEVHRDDVEATGYVRYVRTADNAERIFGPYCYRCQVEVCAASRFRERQGEIRELGAVPLDYRERLDEADRTGAARRMLGLDAQVDAYARATNAGNGGARLTIRDGLAAAYAQRERETRSMDREARIRERVRDLLDEIASVELSRPDMDPYPASVGEVADEIARYVLELEDGPARGVLTALSGRLVCDATEHPDGHLFPYVCVMMRGHGGDHVDPVTGKWSESGHLDADEIKRTEGAPEIVARRVCRQGDHRDGRDTATVRIRYQYADDRAGTWAWTTDMCDRHGTLTYERFMREGKRNVEIMPAGWTPAWDVAEP